MTNNSNILVSDSNNSGMNNKETKRMINSNNSTYNNYTANESYKELDSFDAYCKEASQYAPLTREEEIECSKIIMAGGEDAAEAIDKLVKHNQKRAIKYAKKYEDKLKNTSAERGDLTSIISIAMNKAALKYDYRKAANFGTYCDYWIKQEVTRELNKNYKDFKITSHEYEKSTKMLGAKSRLEAKLDREPTIEEIARESGYSEKLVKDVFYNGYNRQVDSLSKPLDKESGITLEETIADTYYQYQYEGIEKREIIDALYEALDTLNDRDRLIIELFFGLNDYEELKPEQIAKHPAINLSRGRIYKIVKNTLAKLHDSEQLRDFEY